MNAHPIGAWRHVARLGVLAVATASLGGGLLVGALSAPAGAVSPTLYVAKSGTDVSNTCTNLRQPCLTLDHAISLAPAGSIIDIGPGTYSQTGIDIEENLTLSGASGVVISGGDPAQGITVKIGFDI